MPNRITYAIGDVHGRADLLDLVIEAVKRDARDRGRAARMVFLGDYVDRGPDSRRVVETLMALEDPESCLCLRGNHEELMVEALTHARRGAYARWCANGGRETLASYGVTGGEDPDQAIPAEHVRWLSNLPLIAEDPYRIYVHAGLSPRKPLEDQSEAACLWIREKFLRAPARDFDRHIVHGHTPVWDLKPTADQPELLDHRTNLDTAAFASGVLSVGVFDENLPGGPINVLSLRGSPSDYPLGDVADEPAARPAPTSLFRRLTARFRAVAD